MAAKRASKKKASGKKRPTRKKLGPWKVKRVGDDQLLVRLPSGMKIKGKEPISIEDLLSGIANYMVAKRDPQLACCSKKVMVA